MGVLFGLFIGVALWFAYSVGYFVRDAQIERQQRKKRRVE